MSWKPSGQWKKDFRQALVNAFTLQDMVILLGDYFNQSFANMSINPFGSSYDYLVFQLIDKARMEDWLVDLVAAAHERRPDNPELLEISEELGLTVTGPRLDNPTNKPFQEIVNENAQFINFADFIEQASRLQGQVCWINIPGGGGTGFLVGPDLVLTNFHVIQRIKDGHASPQDVKCVFDYKKTVDGSTLNKKPVTEVPLKNPEWLVDSLPTSKFDWNPDLGDAGKDELDYGLIRLESEAGNMPVGGVTADSITLQNNQIRGWIDTTVDAPGLAAGNQVFLLQHPKGDPLQMAVGEVVEFNGKGTRMRYNANSKDGSSGSPCFNADLQLVALHHAYDINHKPPHWNQAVPFSVIRSAWQNRNIVIP
jgi:V8-like Glu-specific endopeptidase